MLNCTPDSFYDGATLDGAALVAKGLRLVEEGADIIDVGGESSRPGAPGVSATEEMARVLPVIAGLRQAGCRSISCDTRKAEVARAALEAGATIINDISAGRDPAMFPLVARAHCGYIAMHMQGEPATMQKDPVYSDVVAEVTAFLEKRTQDLVALGARRQDILWDPGIGFGKKPEHNLALLRGLQRFTRLSRVCVGVSRKSLVAALSPATGKDPGARLAGSLAALVPALRAGALCLRVHDVAATRQFLEILRELAPDIMIPRP